jgi:hypothetical protein
MRKLNIALLTLVLIPMSAIAALANPTKEYVTEESVNNLSEVLVDRPSTQAIFLTHPELIQEASELDSQVVSQLVSPTNSDAIEPTNKDNVNPETDAVDPAEIQRLQTELEKVKNTKYKKNNGGTPALTIANPTGYGGDGGRWYVSPSLQSARFADEMDGTLGMGIALGNARKAVGFELGYSMASFGGSRDFGSGGFNMKVHRQLADDFAVAAGWNGFANLGGGNDFEDSVYGVATKIFSLREDVNSSFSRLAFSAGLGNGQFRTEDATVRGDDGVNVFGSMALRVARPLSFVTEWTGQDLAMGLSIVPFKNFPLTITPAFRDITGAGDGARFVLGTGIGFGFGNRF